MKIAVLGGTGLIGSRVVKCLEAAGHEAVALSKSTGVDLLTGEGLAPALEGADAVVDVTNSPTFDEASSAFFRTTTEHLLAAAREQGVGHVVLLSVVGVDQVPGLDYYRAKVLQEDMVKAGPVPYSIIRATQFFEFVDDIMSWSADEETVRLPRTRVQPIAAADVAQAVAEAAVERPFRATDDIAGADVFPLDELGRVTLAARGDRRTVTTDDTAGMFAAVPEDAIIAGPDVRIAPTRYRDWLAG
ncbi:MULTISPECIES: NAD(P)H-binding protein [unclassified Streptomyces]|uniref:SDR family oxidoreductase n=1 Tax=unclassified Streptomyces TaxID=2593676 RepID=UPI0001C1A811|nr:MULTISPECIES: NAD(P)H-binding protein [unclassified Streptomyces]AEN10240.1 NAD-dependent epimerase/dehydratase [Streptomyces sp. SirexAA-E]MYR66908.1 NAD(P)H-binding protein [Streptomyces sp. SID4939]MYR98889.1 NAD(P)H-binding protein [Streptomyces sp. SID4940]MYT65391.1 NAD(P)H-binding protein [Streptomyces sp. SID8357]MYT84446.1 NAD(P)H-binding protein [Streptomyces sp. SID8360]